MSGLKTWPSNSKGLNMFPDNNSSQVSDHPWHRDRYFPLDPLILVKISCLIWASTPWWKLLQPVTNVKKIIILSGTNVEDVLIRQRYPFVTGWNLSTIITNRGLALLYSIINYNMIMGVICQFRCCAQRAHASIRSLSRGILAISRHSNAPHHIYFSMLPFMCCKPCRNACIAHLHMYIGVTSHASDVLYDS